ncbi:MAG: hypothetical protein HY040_19555 [Planctomycetes bacterium]|nr:hypothetical protein [Planctomycetota bacterium]
MVLAGIQLGNAKDSLESATLMIASTFVLTLVGGWFGGQLFPPICAVKRRSRLLTD